MKPIYNGFHRCHGGCGRPCHPRFWGCWPCWRKLPQFIQRGITLNYRSGQEISKNPSPAYLACARAAQVFLSLPNVRINDIPGGRLLTNDERSFILSKMRYQMKEEGLLG